MNEYQDIFGHLPSDLARGDFRFDADLMGHKWYSALQLFALAPGEITRVDNLAMAA